MKRTISIIILIVVMAVGSFAQNDKTSIAVWDFEAMGLSSQEVDILSRRVISLLVATNHYIVTDRNNMKAILEEQSFQASGCAGNECIVEIGQMLGVQKMLSGSIGKFGSMFTIEMYLIDIQTGQIERSANHDIIGEMELLLTQGIGSALNKLLGEDANPVQSTGPASGNGMATNTDLPVTQQEAVTTAMDDAAEEDGNYVPNSGPQNEAEAEKVVKKRKSFLDMYVGADLLAPVAVSTKLITELNLTNKHTLSVGVGYNYIAIDESGLAIDLMARYFLFRPLSLDLGYKIAFTNYSDNEYDSFSGTYNIYQFYAEGGLSYGASLILGRLMLNGGMTMVYYEEFDSDDFRNSTIGAGDYTQGVYLGLGYRLF